MSVVTYNGVSLPYPFATDFRQDGVYDDVSGTDRILSKFDIRVQCVITSNYLSLLAPGLITTSGNNITTNPAAIMKVVRNLLLQPRRSLSYKMNGIELLPLQQSIDSNNTNTVPGTVDAKNGPIPQSCIITNLTNSTFLLTYHIIAHYWENLAETNNNTVPSANRTGNDVLYNRWTETVNLDRQMFSTKTRSGKFMIRSDNVDGTIADVARSQMAVVGCPQGFQRESAEYSITPDGLGIRYTVVDKEAYRLPPFPAYKAEGHIAESAGHGVSCFRMIEARIRLTGRNDATEEYGTSDLQRQNLIAAAIYIVAFKIKENGYSIPTSARVWVDLYNPIVECQMTAIGKMLLTGQIIGTPIAGKNRQQGIWNFDTRMLSSTLINQNQQQPAVGPVNPITDLNGGGPNRPGIIVNNIPTMEGPVPWQPTYYDRGTGLLLLQAAAFYDPSLTNWRLNRTTGQMQKGPNDTDPYGKSPGQTGLFGE